LLGLRLVALLAVAALAGSIVAATASGRRLQAPAAAARIPALPVVAAPRGVCPIPTAFRPAFERAAHETGLPLALLAAVAEVESRFRPDARSSADARGLLQVMPATAAELRLDADAPEGNVLAGARYLRVLFSRLRSADLALAAYNAGPSAVERAGGAPTTQTLTYVANVTARWRALVGCDAG
jgi:soluble lytic murein transglycosylase-like protein